MSKINKKLATNRSTACLFFFLPATLSLRLSRTVLFLCALCCDVQLMRNHVRWRLSSGSFPVLKYLSTLLSIFTFEQDYYTFCKAPLAFSVSSVSFTTATVPVVASGICKMSPIRMAGVKHSILLKYINYTGNLVTAKLN